MSIVEQAVRLNRKKWGDYIQPLVDELYLILTDQDLPNTGASELSLAPPGAIPGGGAVQPISTPFKVDPLPPWTFPPLDLPAILFGDTVPTNSDPNPDSQDPASNQTQQTKTSTQYLTVPGKISASDGKGGYTVQLYVNGIDEKGSRSVSVTEINKDSGLEVGTFTMVSGIIVMKLTTTSVFNGPAPTSTNTSIRIQSEKYYCQTGGGGGSVVPAQITSGTGDTYQATLYPNGPDGTAGDSVTFKQLQIDDDQTIPSGTWVLAVKGKIPASNGTPAQTVFLGQAPVWL